MAGANRAKFLENVLKLLNKNYEVSSPSKDRPALEQAVFGACLENGSLEAAEAAFARLKEGYFDWNEVRVSSPRELAESLHGVPAPLDHARTVKAILQAVFETYYQFDLEPLRRMTQGQALRELHKLGGMTPFVAVFVLQNSLQAHVIPLDEASIRAVRRLGLVREDTDPEEMRASLEHLIPKARGPAFCSLIRQLALDVCLADEPKFRRCVLAELCPTAQQMQEEAKKPRSSKASKRSSNGKSEERSTRKRR